MNRRIHEKNLVEILGPIVEKCDILGGVFTWNVPNLFVEKISKIDENSAGVCCNL
jgi:hypothetical protein